MAKIEDGKGSGRSASVSTAQRLNVSAKTAKRSMYASRDEGLAYVAVYDPINAAAGDYVMYLKNDSSTRNMFISVISLSGVNNIKWRFWEVTGTAASGESVTPTPLNLSKNIPAEATAMAGNTTITGLTLGASLGTHRSPANGNLDEDFDFALILGPGDAIMFEYESGTTGDCEGEINLHYEGLNDQ